MQPKSSTPAPEAGQTGPLPAVLAGGFIAALFLFFTWRGLLVYYTGDDVMNLYGYWSKPLGSLIKANIFFWTPYYRPFGGIIYRIVFGIFGFNPYPLYAVYLAAMLANLWLAYLVLKRMGGSREIGALATLLFAFHGKLDYLYYNAGSMYDVFCFLFFLAALLIYLRARTQDRFLGAGAVLGFLACFICALNSKEMAAALPLIVLIYELIFHPPDFRGMRALIRWSFREGRMTLLGALCVLVYIPAKLSSEGLTSSSAYVPSYTWARWIEDTGTYVGYLLYRNNPTTPLGVTPLGPLGLAVFFAILLATALWMRSRAVWFGLLYFVIALLPVSFVPARLGFVLYLPLAGLALFAAVCLVRFKEGLWRLISDALSGTAATRAAAATSSAAIASAGQPPVRAASPLAAAVALFAATAVVISVIDYRNWLPAPDPQFSSYKNTIADLSRLYPKLPHGSKLLFIRSALDQNYDMVFLLRLYYRDTDLFLTEMNGPLEQRIPLERLPHYDHIFDFEDGHYEELDNTDTIQSVQLHRLKAARENNDFGEVMTIGKPGAAHYIVKGVLVGDPKADGYWTLDEPELRFQLSSVEHHLFSEHFMLPLETLKQTGPLLVDFYVNGHLLDRARFAKDGEVIYQHDVPVDWLKAGSLTAVRMQVHNPYIAPRDGARLGFILRSALFAPAVAQIVSRGVSSNSGAPAQTPRETSRP